MKAQVFSEGVHVPQAVDRTQTLHFLRCTPLTPCPRPHTTHGCNKNNKLSHYSVLKVHRHPCLNILRAARDLSARALLHVWDHQGNYCAFILWLESHRWFVWYKSAPLQIYHEAGPSLWGSAVGLLSVMNDRHRDVSCHISMSNHFFRMYRAGHLLLLQYYSTS